MAYWIIDFRGFEGTYYTCSDCGEVYNDICEYVYLDGPCPNCFARMDEDEHVYMRYGKLEEQND